MCGIAGIISLNPNNIDYPKLKSMTDSIAHRGPDGEGQWINENGIVGLAHRRLSIIDLNTSAAQPMHYLDRYTIVFNGEIYNYVELKKQLLSKGYSFNTNSDTEVLLALFDFKKEKCLNDLDGMFAFAIWDKQEQLLFCARDRFGEKPFFYHHNNESFYFASEMKALWAAGIKKNPFQPRVFLYLAYGAQDDIQNPSTTFYDSIHQLEPSHYFYVRENKIFGKTRYWDIDPAKRNTGIELDEAKSVFYELFKSSIQRRMRSDVPIGSSLSGGLDSTSIVAILNGLKQKEQIQKTFSARFKDYIRDEGTYIDLVISKYNLDPFQVSLTASQLNQNIEKVFYYQEEPFGSTSILAQWEVMKLAKEEHVTVLLDGQGADEILGGYEKYHTHYLSSLLLHNKKELKSKKQDYIQLYNKKPAFGPGTIIDSYFPKLRNFTRNSKNKLIKPDYLTQFHPDFLDNNKDVHYNSEYLPDLNKALYISTMQNGLNSLLRYSDRNSMAHGREVRLPFLNHQLVEFVFSLPDHFKIEKGWTKALLRETMNGIIPNEICWRKEKVGFEPPDSLFVDEDRRRNSQNLLVKNNILSKSSKLRNADWQYYQISLLYGG